MRTKQAICILMMCLCIVCFVMSCKLDGVSASMGWIAGFAGWGAALVEVWKRGR